MALTRESNYKLEVDKEKRRKKEEIVERQTIKAMAVKYYNDKRGISLFSKKEGNYENDTKDTKPS